jgi:hypothetical protein
MPPTLLNVCWKESEMQYSREVFMNCKIPKRVLYMNLETKRLRCGPRNRWKDEVSEDRRIVGGKGWQEKVCYREEWKKLLRMARNPRILHIPLE